MKVYQRPGELFCTATRLPRCADCGERLEREQRDFWLPLTGPHAIPLAVGALLQAVAAWKSAPVPCTRCPDEAVKSA